MKSNQIPATNFSQPPPYRHQLHFHVTARSVVITLQIPEMQTSLAPTLHGVPSKACSPQGTIRVSFISLQYNSQGSSEMQKFTVYIMHNFWFLAKFQWMMEKVKFENMQPFI